MNPLLKAGEIDYFFTDSGAKIAFVWPDFVPEATKGAQNSGTQIIECGPMGPVAGSFEGGDPITDPHERADDDTAIILYTSGTTGRPKGAELTHSNIHLNALRSAKVIQQMTADDIVMGCLPLFHVFGWSSAQRRHHRRGIARPHPALRPRRSDRGHREGAGDDHAGRTDDVRRDPQPPGIRRHGRVAAHLRVRRLRDAAGGDALVRGEVRLCHPRGLRPVRDLARRVVQHADDGAQARHDRRLAASVLPTRLS